MGNNLLVTICPLALLNTSIRNDLSVIDSTFVPSSGTVISVDLKLRYVLPGFMSITKVVGKSFTQPTKMNSDKSICIILYFFILYLYYTCLF